jgi:hypothetical protein
MVNHGLFAFCASDSAINATGALKNAYIDADEEHHEAALKAIRPFYGSVALGDQWYVGNMTTYLPVMATLMTLVAHGVSTYSSTSIFDRGSSTDES